MYRERRRAKVDFLLAIRAVFWVEKGPGQPAVLGGIKIVIDGATQL
jgi:hypothetical protein